MIGKRVTVSSTKDSEVLKGSIVSETVVMSVVKLDDGTIHNFYIRNRKPMAGIAYSSHLTATIDDK